MYAVLEVGGFEVTIRERERVLVPRLRAQEGETVELGPVLLLASPEGSRIGQPYLEDVRVKAQVIRHFQGKKVIVFKFKKRKRYKRTRGSRPLLTEVLIERIETPETL